MVDQSNHHFSADRFITMHVGDPFELRFQQEILIGLFVRRRYQWRGQMHDGQASTRVALTDAESMGDARVITGPSLQEVVEIGIVMIFL